MTQTTSAPSEPTWTDIELGLVFEDRRTGDLRKVIYADESVVLVRDASGHTTLAQRNSFRSQLGTRYRPRPDADPLIEGGQFDRLIERVEEYERRDGRTASHKAEALAEAIELLTDPDGDDSVREEVAFEDVDGVGPETAGRLRSSGFVTRRDVLAADDEDLLDVTGVGPSTLENVREFVDGDD